MPYVFSYLVIMKVLSVILWKIRSILQMKHGGFKWFTVVSGWIVYIYHYHYTNEVYVPKVRKFTRYKLFVVCNWNWDRRSHDHTVVRFTTTFAISAYHRYSCEFESRSWWGVLDTTLCDKLCQWLAPVSFTNITDHHDVAEILLKVVLNTITLEWAYILKWEWSRSFLTGILMTKTFLHFRPCI